MSAIVAWWAIPLLATLTAMAWVAWAGSRSSSSGSVHDSTRRYERFRAAMEKDRQAGRPG